MLQQPQISIIIPVYNVEKYLVQCLESVVNQTYRDIEIICVNDGTKDNSGEILVSYAEKDPRVSVINQENKGLSGARNTGMRYAHGKYIMFVDADDWIDLDTCEKAICAAQKYSADLVLWSYVREFENEAKEKLMFWDHETVFDSEQVRSQLHRRLCGLYGEELRHPEYANAIETAWGKLYLAEKILSNHVEFINTKEIGTEDALFNLYALGYIQKAVYLRRCFNHYRKTNGESLTTTYNPFLFERWQRLFLYMDEYIQVNHLSVDYNQALSNRIALSLLGIGLNIAGSDYSIGKKLRLIQAVLNDKRYIEAYRNLDFQYFPLHWKIFYGCAKYRFSAGVLLMLTAIKLILKK